MWEPRNPQALLRFSAWYAACQSQPWTRCVGASKAGSAGGTSRIAHRRCPAQSIQCGSPHRRRPTHPHSVRLGATPGPVGEENLDCVAGLPKLGCPASRRSCRGEQARQCCWRFGCVPQCDHLPGPSGTMAHGTSPRTGATKSARPCGRRFTSRFAQVDLQQRFAKAARLAKPGARPALAWSGDFRS